MQTSRRVLLFLIAFAIFSGSFAAAMTQKTPGENGQEKDRAAIEQTVANFMGAWNTHDVHALSLLFTEDNDFTNAFGDHNQGRAPIEATYGPMFAGAFRETRQTGQIRIIRFLTPNVASVDVDWQMTGVKNPDGSPRPARKGLLSWIMAKQGDGSWLVEIMHMNEFTDTPVRLAPAPAK
jgi:uncharacterized protein (TIGR02246 family)